MPLNLNVARQDFAAANSLIFPKSKRRKLARGEIRATEYIRRMRGGSHACLLRCSDKAHYVVKVQNNPQGKRILANELLGTLLAKKLSLPVAEPAVVNVSKDFILASSEMVIREGRSSTPMESGRCFGSRVPRHGEPSSSRISPLEFVHEVIPGKQFNLLGNVADVAGMLVFDKWTCNTDGRQTIFVQDGDTESYSAVMIDQGFCFNGPEWRFPDSLLHCIGLYHSVYDRIPGFSNFEPWLEILENFIDRDVLASVAQEIPPEWYHDDHDSLRRLLDWLDLRRMRVADSVFSVWRNYQRIFTNRTFSHKCASSPCRKDSRQLSFADLENW